MQDLAELERRISAALTQIGEGLSARSAVPAAEVTRLEAELAAERAARAALEERLAALSAAPPVAAPLPTDLEDRIERMTRQLDVQGIEMVRLRKAVGGLRENLRALRSVQAGQVADPTMINRALQAEVDAMRAERLSEMAELDEILSELDPLIGPAAQAPAQETREDA